MTTKLARIVGVGSYLPERVLSNADLEAMVETDDQWITERTGIKERRLAREDETTSMMGTEAAKRAIAASGVAAEDIDLVLVATFTPDYVLSNNASLIAQAVGAVNAGAADMQTACTGHLYALATAKAYVESGIYRNILVVSSDKVSAHVDYTDRRTCILFGDAATAAVVSDQGAGFAVETVHLGSDGARSDLLYVPGGGTAEGTSPDTIERKRHYVSMQGQEVFKYAVRKMTSAAEASLSSLGLGADDIKWLVPHQANTRIIEATAKRCNFPMDRVYMDAVRHYGNTSAPSIGVALDELIGSQPIETGQRPPTRRFRRWIYLGLCRAEED